MSETDPLKSSQMLSRLQLLRSEDPADRQRGVEALAPVAGDPRVQQVFEYLYEKDPDPGVREAVWAALVRQGPSVPAPTPAPKRGPSRVRRKSTARRSTFLLDPANRARVRRHLSEGAAPARRSGSALGLLVALLLAGAGFLWGLAAPAWYDWYRLREDGAHTEATLTGLSAPLDTSENAPVTVFYRFSPAGEADDEAPVYFGKQRIDADLYRWLSQAGVMSQPVIYLPADPAVSRLDIDTWEDTRREQLAIAAGGISVIALLVSLMGWITRLPSRGGLQGKLLQGQVVAAKAQVASDKNRRVTVRFRFRAPNGRVITSEATRVRGDLSPATLPPPGTPVLVEYHSVRRFRLL